MRGSSHLGSVTSLLESKYFHPFMTLTVPGSARIRVFPPLAGSWVRVCSWQWSVLGWLMTTRSGSGSSRRFEMHDGSFCLDTENLGCHILEGPDSHGSRRMVNSFVGCPGEGGKGRMGRKVRRNEASELRCLIVNAIG